MSPAADLKFRLYVAGGTLNSVEALANLTEFCEEYLSGRHVIEIVDVVENPMRALDDGIFMTPTLVKFMPLPTLRIVGTLRDQRSLIHILDSQARSG